ncbi:helix-turn-helix domain-containing protein [Nocardia huaxiensis]|uniref:Helix-turn-helix transcriptional regulator n=1 Tax=Nocardia huaxiensis TaxID=2755382 RepID=A0A7D6V517_9NOCA|nr:helix-turn-helix transcriptional regulator [Nocardia huaxiensis]QLY27552.1 helix-turn-helix transcriptional regulator [Nocardia huaxiensis]UFS99071.1 helix-turn-helix domain-containing protein [Nocardia huaxiensis]
MNTASDDIDLLPVQRQRRTRFAARLDWLLLHTKPSRPLSHLQVVRGLAAHGYTVSPAYLSQLRTGVRSTPSNALVTVLARYFGVDVEYFYAPPRTPGTTAMQHDSRVIDRLGNPHLRRLLLTAHELPAESQELLADVAARLYAGEHDSDTTAATA